MRLLFAVSFSFDQEHVTDKAEAVPVRILLKILTLHIIQPPPGGDAQPVFIHPGDGKVVLSGTGCGSEAVRPGLYIKANTPFPPDLRKVWPDRHDDRDILPQHVFCPLPQAARRKAPSCRIRHLLFLQKTMYTGHEHQTIDSGIGDHREIPLIHA